MGDVQHEIEPEERTEMNASTNLTKVVETRSLLHLIDITKYTTYSKKFTQITALVIYVAKKWRQKSRTH